MVWKIHHEADSSFLIPGGFLCCESSKKLLKGIGNILSFCLGLQHTQGILKFTGGWLFFLSRESIFFADLFHATSCAQIDLSHK